MYFSFSSQQYSNEFPFSLIIKLFIVIKLNFQFSFCCFHHQCSLLKKTKTKTKSNIKERKKGKMIIPVRCYSCGKTIAHLYEPYRKLLDEDYTEAEALAAVGCVRYCCRRMLLTHIDLIDGLMPYSSPVVGTMQKFRPGGQPQQQQQQVAVGNNNQQQQQQTGLPQNNNNQSVSGAPSSTGSSVSAPSTKRNALQ